MLFKQDHARLEISGFSDIFYLGIIHRNLCRRGLAGMKDRKHRRLILGRQRDLLSAGEHYRMAARRILDMEPEILAPGGMQGKFIVLRVVASDQNLKAIR